jgi:hypothetical protein
MRSVFAGMLLAAAVASAQSIVNPARLNESLRSMQPAPGERPMECSVTPIRPVLNFSLRIQAGYTVRVPMSQYFGAGHTWVQLARITPAAGDRPPVYLGYRTRLPDVPKTSVEVDLGGGYLLGEGAYDVHWAMFDDSGRVCRKQWRIDARLSRKERKAKPMMQPYTVAAFSLVDASRAAPPPPRGSAPLRITVLLHAAPMSPRRTHFGAADRMMLLGSLAALMEQLPGAAIRLVAFNLDKQKEILRQDNFQPEMLERAEKAMDGVELDLADVRTLQHPLGHLDLLASLVNRELRADPAPDAVLFFGPRTRFLDKAPHFAMPEGAPPRFFALQFRPFLRVAAATLPDAIGNTVASLKGKVVTIHSPADFAKAITLLQRRSP